MKPLRLIVSSFWLTFAVMVILAAILISVARLTLPMMGEYRGDVSAWVGDLLGQPVRIGALGASWSGWGPSMELRDVTVLDAAGKQAVLQCESARIDINLLASLREWQFEPGLLTVRGLHLSLVRHEDGGIVVAGLGGVEHGSMDEASKGTLKHWLQRQERLAIEHSSLQWRDLTAGGKTWEFSDVNLQLRNRDDRHRLDVTVDLPDVLGKSLKMEMDVRGDLFTTQFWQGQVYARGTALKLAGWWGDHPPLGLTNLSGVVDFQGWSEWLNGVQQVEGDVHAHALHAARAAAVDDVDTSAQQMDIDSLSGGFHWRRRRPGWMVDMDNFSITRYGAASRPAQLRLEYYKDERTGNHRLQTAFSALRVEDVAGLLLEAKQVPAGSRAHLSAMAPTGMLRNGYIEYSDGPERAPHFVLRGKLSDVAWRADGSLPGIKGLSGLITADEQGGMMTLATESAAVDFVKQFRTPLPVDALAGRIAWRRDGKDLRIDAAEMTARNEDLKLKFGFLLDMPGEEGVSPYLDLNAEFDEGKLEHIARYLPAKLSDSPTGAWLNRAIVAGRVSGGTARVQGRLGDFPFDRGNGVFDIRCRVTDGILEYVAGWPRLEKIDAEVSFHGRRVEVNAAAARSFDSEVSQVRAIIPDMTAHPAQLTVEGQAHGPLADGIRYLTESPLRAKFGAYMKGISASGNGRLRLRIQRPLAKQLPTRVQGSLRVTDGALSFRNADIDLSRIDGDLNFTEKGLAADNIHADLIGQPVVIGAKTEPARTGAVTTFSLRGTADAAAMAKRFAPPFAPFVVGTTPWQGQLRIPPKSEGWVELQVDSSLKGVVVNLPSPMSKETDTARELLVQVPLPVVVDKPVHIRYGDVADAQLALAKGKDGMTVARGEVLLGGGTAVLPTSDEVRLAGSLASFDESQWSAVLARATAGQSATAAPVVTQIDMSFDQLKIAGHSLSKVGLKAERGDDAWDVNINSDQAQGHIHLPDAVDAPLVLDMEHLYLPRFKKGGEGKTPPDPRKVHPLDITAKHFHYGDLDLGELHLQASRVPDGLSFDEIHTHSDKRDLKAKGNWLTSGNGQRSSFTLAYDGDDAGATLTSLGFAGVIKGGKTHTDLKLDWQGSPADFALAKAAGSLSFEIKDGRLLDVDPGAGRILGLLSFQVLPRRLLLDFSDLFQKGFSFDSLAGSFAIEDGNAQTDNLYMDGPAARIEARGRVGLATEDYDQRVTVIPNVSSGLPVAGAIAGGVGAGAALLLAEKILKPGIDKFTRVDYKVTGPWANPIVERLTTGGKPQGKNNDQ